MTSKLPSAVSTLTMICLSAIHVNGAVLLLDFGPTISTGSNLTNSPFHSENGSTASTWNTIGTGDSSSLNWGDGSVATGVTVDIGRSSNNSIIDFSAQPSASNALGIRINTGVFSGDSVGKDGIFSGSGGENNALGLQISGLTVGVTYEIFVVGLNTNIEPGGNSGLPQNIGAFASSDNATLDIGSLSTTTVDNYSSASSPDSSGWAEGTNFAHFSVEITADNPVLTIFTVGNGDRGFLNSVQVVPEPATYAAFFGLAALAFVVWRRRR